jgi:quinoprotein glucose dehydrogenase
MEAGGAADAQYGTRPGMFENTPLMIDNVLYLSTPYNRVVALDAEPGAQLWAFDPQAYVAASRRTARASSTAVSPRGATAARVASSSTAVRGCSRSTAGRESPSKRSATRGSVDLTKGLAGRSIRRVTPNTSPPVVYRDLVIVGNGVGDRLVYKNDPPGDVRAFDVRSGKVVWTFHTTPMDGDAETKTWGNESWKITGHAKSGRRSRSMPVRGLVYLPVSTPSNDYYGVHRPGDNLFADSIVCLDAATGARKWHFQFAHHGLWDYDPPAAPCSPDHGRRRRIDAVVQVTKQGFAFVFDRVTGRRSGRSSSGPCRPATSKANRRRRRSRFRAGPRRFRRRASRSTTPST